MIFQIQQILKLLLMEELFSMIREYPAYSSLRCSNRAFLLNRAAIALSEDFDADSFQVSPGSGLFGTPRGTESDLAVKDVFVAVEANLSPMALLYIA